VQEPPLARGKARAEMNALQKLDASELSVLDKHESVIERGLKTFADVGSALLAIRDGRLYREQHTTFEAYCRERWGFSRSRAHRLIDAAQVCETLPMGNKPQSERQARPLSRLPAADQPEAWKAANEKAESEQRPVTARDVETEVNKRKPRFENPQQEEGEYEKNETQVITDPLSGRVETPIIDPEDDKKSESQNLAGLKRYWNYANKRERKAFLEWIKKEGAE
jgi:hypothetical protein